MDITDTQRLDWVINNCKVRCWDTYNYEYLETVLDRSVIDSKIRWDGRKELPKVLVRMDDGQEFIQNEKTGMYYLKMNQKALDDGHVVMEYSWDRLMVDYRTAGKFKVQDGTIDCKALQDAWMEMMRKPPEER